LRQEPVIFGPDEFQIAFVRARLLALDYEEPGEGKRPLRVKLPPVDMLWGGGQNDLDRVPLEKKSGLPPGVIFAYRIEARRMGIIAASFPYKKQVEEFKQQLRLATHGDVLTEKVRGGK
jgi:hypothetical protein